MADKKTLLELKKKMKAKRPTFIRSSAKIKKRVSSSGWRKPKGLQNKMRLKKKGYHRCVDTGYGTPVEVRHIDTKTGLLPAVVSSQKDLETINSQTHAIILSSKLGIRKKQELIKSITEKNLVLIQGFDKIKSSIDNVLKTKEQKKKKKLERTKVKESKQKKASEAKKKEDAKKEKLDSANKSFENSDANAHDLKAETTEQKEAKKVFTKKDAISNL